MAEFPVTFPNWFRVNKVIALDLQLGMTLTTGHDKNDTAGVYVITNIERVDADTVLITTKRVRRG